MVLITCCYLSFLESNAHMLPFSALLYLPSHCMPCLQGHLLLPSPLVLFIFPVPSKSQIRGKTPAVCGWTKQLHRNSDRNTEDSLSDVMDGPRPPLVLCICLSLSHKEERMSSLQARIWLPRSPSIPVHWLKGSPLQLKHFLQSISLSPEKAEAYKFWRANI